MTQFAAAPTRIIIARDYQLLEIASGLAPVEPVEHRARGDHVDEGAVARQRHEAIFDEAMILVMGQGDRTLAVGRLALRRHPDAAVERGGFAAQMGVGLVEPASRHLALQGPDLARPGEAVAKADTFALPHDIED